MREDLNEHERAGGRGRENEVRELEALKKAKRAPYIKKRQGGEHTTKGHYNRTAHIAK